MGASTYRPAFLFKKTVMPYKNIVFAKLEKRLFNDPRWYMMSEPAQLNYIRFILFAAETYNKIPKNLTAIRKGFKTDQDEQTVEKTIKEIKSNFKKFKENRHYYYFDEFHEKTNYIPKREKLGKSQRNPKEATDKDKEEEEEEEEDKDKDKYKYKSKHNKRKKRFSPPTPEEIAKYCQERQNNVDPDKFCNFYQAKNWYIGKNKMKDWKAAVRTWERKRLEMPKSTKRPAIILIAEMKAAKFGKEDIKQKLLEQNYTEREIDHAMGKMF